MADTFPVYYKSTTDTIGQALVFTSVKTQNTPNALAVYPNPTSDVLYMELDGIASKSLQIWDAQGKSIKFLNGSNLGRLNVLDLKPGLYNLKMVLENGKTRLGRFVKE